VRIKGKAADMGEDTVCKRKEKKKKKQTKDEILKEEEGASDTWGSGEKGSGREGTWLRVGMEQKRKGGN